MNEDIEWWCLDFQIFPVPVCWGLRDHVSRRGVQQDFRRASTFAASFGLQMWNVYPVAWPVRKAKLCFVLTMLHCETTNKARNRWMCQNKPCRSTKSLFFAFCFYELHELELCVISWHPHVYQGKRSSIHGASWWMTLWSCCGFTVDQSLFGHNTKTQNLNFGQPWTE